MAGTAKSELVEWVLGLDEIPKFVALAAEHHIKMDGVPRKDADGRRVYLQVVRPALEQTYRDFAIAVRPHHQSDS